MAKSKNISQINHSALGCTIENLSNTTRINLNHKLLFSVSIKIASLFSKSKIPLFGLAARFHKYHNLSCISFHKQ